MKDKTPIILMIAILILGGLLFSKGGIHAVISGVTAGAHTFLKTILLLVAAFLVAGFTQILVTEEFVTKWLGEEAGLKAIGLACVAGALIPGGPYVYYPIAAVITIG